MNKVIAIHLRGVAFQLEEEGYDALRAYLDGAARTLASNPDKAEIIADIEQSIGDKFRGRLSESRNVILAPDVKAVLAEMGPVSDDSAATETTANASAGDAKTASTASPGENTDARSEFEPEPPRKLYTLSGGAVLGGVCNGLAAYLGVEVTLLRLAFVILCFFSFGTLAALYFIATLIIPEAKTPEEKAAARAPSSTAKDFIRRAEAGYYEGLKSMPDREARREWKRKFRREMRHKFGWQWDNPTGCGATGAPAQPLPPGSYLLLSLLSTLKGLLTLLAVIVALSLLFTGTILSVPFPGTIPHWVGLLFLFLAYKIAVTPLKIARRAIWYRHAGGGARHWRWHPVLELWNGLVAICFAVLFIWLADRFIPQFHTGLQHLPVLMHQIADSVQQWWNSGG